MRILSIATFALLAATTNVVPAAPSTDVARAWAAPVTTVTDTSEKTFSDGPVTLSGTLYMPRGAQHVSAVIAFHGASEPTRDLALYKHLKQMLPPLGMAVFVFDRRGSGKSGGKPADGNYAALADDGIAAQKMLMRDPRIDPKRIGFWGLSQGGWIALLAASRSPATAFAIAVSAPMVTPTCR